MTKLLLVLQALLSSIAASATTFEYVSPIDSSSLTIDTTASSVAVGDVARNAVLCAGSSNFVCVESDVFRFAVPTKIGPETTRWEHGERTYSIEFQGDITLLGILERGAIRISSADGGRRFSYLYSPEKGLLAVGVSSKDGSKLFLITSNVGYGAVDRKR